MPSPTPPFWHFSKNSSHLVASPFPQKTSRRPGGPTKIKKGGREGGGAVSPRFFDLLNSMIFDLKRSVDQRRLFHSVLHLSIDDRCSLFSVILVLSAFIGHCLCLSPCICHCICLFYLYYDFRNLSPKLP